jgi:hypothetical protein
VILKYEGKPSTCFRSESNTSPGMVRSCSASADWNALIAALATGSGLSSCNGSIRTLIGEGTGGISRGSLTFVVSFGRG